MAKIEQKILMANILIVDDQIVNIKLLEKILTQAGYINIFSTTDSRQAIAMYLEHDIDLLLLDIRMPNMDGFEACQEIRKVSDVPILMLTALGDDMNEIKGMNIGADDYISKPFSYSLLLAHINALLRRKETIKKKVLCMVGIEVDGSGRNVFIDGQKINLAPREFNLLIYLVKNKGQALSREQILDRVWGYDYEGDKRTVDTHIKSLRAALGKLGEKIKTVYRYGYLFEEEEK